MTMEYIVGGLSLLCLLQAVLLFRVLRVLGAVDRAEDRLAHFSGALALLTETTEEGFRSLALEITRGGKSSSNGAYKGLGENTKKDAFSAASVVMDKTARPDASPRVMTSRLVRAVHRGRTVPEIAADEQLSQGEVRLRLSLAEAAPRGRARSRKNGEEHHGSMRA